MNLSGECFPVKPRVDLVGHLKAHPGKSFVLAHEVKGETDAPEPLLASQSFSAANPVPSLLGVNPLNAPAEIWRHAEIRFIGDPWLYHYYTAPHRIFSFNQERPSVGEVFLTHPPEFFVSARKYFARKYSRYWQKAWCVLTREFCEFVLRDEVSFSIYDHMRNSSMPEESFFGTVIHNSPFRDLRINLSLTYDNPAKAREIDEEEIPKIDNGVYFFARKFTAKSAAVKKYYRDLIGRTAPLQQSYWDGTSDARAWSKMFEALVQNSDVEWQFGRAFQRLIAILRLGSDGTIIGYSHSNEKRWRLEESLPAIEFMSEGGLLTTSFSSFAFSRNGNIYLFGHFHLGHNVVHYLESKIANHFRRASTIVEVLEWLLSLGRLQSADTTQSADETLRSIFEDGSAEIGEFQATVDGRFAGKIVGAPAAGNRGAEYWLTKFGVIVMNACDLEFATLFHGICDSRLTKLRLFGIGRNFRGKFCSVCLKSS